MLIGRLPIGTITRYLKDLGTLYLYLIVALLGVILFHFSAGQILYVYIAMVLIGFGVGATFPVVLNYIGSTFRSQSGTAFSIALFIALCGQSVLNRFTGWAFDHGDYHWFTVVLMSALVVIKLLVPLAIMSKKRTF